jgi:hypothetical protein
MRIKQVEYGNYCRFDTLRVGDMFVQMGYFYIKTDSKRGKPVDIVTGQKGYGRGPSDEVQVIKSAVIEIE